MNDGQVYVTLTRLEKAGLVASERADGASRRPGPQGVRADARRPAARRRVARPRWAGPSPTWRSSTSSWSPPRRPGWPTRSPSWTRSAASCCAGCATPSAPRMAEPDGSDAALLLEGIVLRLQADLRWLEACEQSWIEPEERIMSDNIETSGAACPRAVQGSTATERGWCARSTGSISTSPPERPGGDGAERLREVHAAAPAGRTGPAVGGRCGWPGAASTSWGEGAGPACGGPTSASCSRPST